MSPHDYRLDINGKTKTFHINLLKQCIARGDEEANQLIEVSDDTICHRMYGYHRRR